MLLVFKVAVPSWNYFFKSNKDVSFSTDGQQFFFTFLLLCNAELLLVSWCRSKSTMATFTSAIYVHTKVQRSGQNRFDELIIFFLISHVKSFQQLLYHYIFSVLIIWFKTNGDSLCCATCDLDLFSNMFSWNRMWVWNHAGGSCRIFAPPYKASIKDKGSLMWVGFCFFLIPQFFSIFPIIICDFLKILHCIAQCITVIIIIQPTQPAEEPKTAITFKTFSLYLWLMLNPRSTSKPVLFELGFLQISVA